MTNVIVVDAPPVIKSATATPTKVAADNTVTFKVTGAVDPDGTVASVNVYWDPTELGTSTAGAVLIGTSSTSPWTVTAHLPALNDSQHPFPTSGQAVFLVQAVDNSSTPGNIVEVKATIVAQPVVAQVTATPAPIDHTLAATFTAGGVTSATGTTVKAVEFWLAPAGATSLDTVADTLLGKVTKGTAGNWVLTLKNLSTVAARNYVVFACAFPGFQRQLGVRPVSDAVDGGVMRGLSATASHAAETVRVAWCSFRHGPDAGRFAFAEEFEMDHVGVTTNWAILDVLLLGPAGSVQGDHDLLAAGGASVGALVGRAAALFAALEHGTLLPRFVAIP